MLDLLKGGKVDINIKLDRSTYYPGDMVKAAISIQNPKELVVREGRTQLVCREDYEYEYESEDEDGSSTNKKWGSTDNEVARLVLVPEGALPAGAHSYDFSARLPDDAVPTWVGGKILKLRWFVRVELDRKMALDFNAESELTVLQTPPGQNATPREIGESESEDVGLSFTLPGQGFVLGERIGGQLVIRAKKNVEVNEVRLQLRRLEQVTNDGDTRRVEYTEAEVKLPGKIKLAAGQSQSVPFSVAIPAARPTTGRTPHCAVSWRLHCALPRGFLRGEYKGQAEIGVYPTRSR